MLDEDKLKGRGMDQYEPTSKNAEKEETTKEEPCKEEKPKFGGGMAYSTRKHKYDKEPVIIDEDEPEEEEEYVPRRRKRSSPNPIFAIMLVILICFGLFWFVGQLTTINGEGNETTNVTESTEADFIIVVDDEPTSLEIDALNTTIRPDTNETTAVRPFLEVNYTTVNEEEAVGEDMNVSGGGSQKILVINVSDTEDSEEEVMTTQELFSYAWKRPFLLAVFIICSAIFVNTLLGRREPFGRRF